MAPVGTEFTIPSQLHPRCLGKALFETHCGVTGIVLMSLETFLESGGSEFEGCFLLEMKGKATRKS